MPIPVQAKKLAEAKAKAAAAVSKKIQVGPTEEELKKKYANQEATSEEQNNSTVSDDDDIIEDNENAESSEEVSDEENNDNEGSEEKNNDNEEANDDNAEEQPNDANEDSGEENNNEENAEEQPSNDNNEEPNTDSPQTSENAEEKNKNIETQDDFFKTIAQERVKLRGQVNETDVNIATIPEKTKEVEPVKEEKLTFEKLIKFNNNTSNVVESIKHEMKFDLDSVEIENSDNDLHVAQAAELAFEEDSVFQVALLKSGYIAHMRSITFRDRDAIRGSLAGNTDNRKIANIRRKIYKIVYDKIAWTNISGNQKFSFDDFLRITAYDDLETLYFGIFCKSNPTDSDYTITCPYCKFKNKRQVNAMSLANFSSKELIDKLNEMLKGEKALNPQEIYNSSLVNKKQRVLLPNSKIIAEIKVPSLGDYLRFTTNYANSSLPDEDLSETIGFLIFLDSILIPDFKKIKTTGKPIYYKVQDFTRMLSFISSLDLGDGETLVDAINEREAKYKIGYRIKSTPCTNCGKELGDTPVSMEDFLL